MTNKRLVVKIPVDLQEKLLYFDIGYVYHFVPVLCHKVKIPVAHKDIHQISFNNFKTIKVS